MKENMLNFYLIAACLIAFIIVGFDKFLAVNKSRRIPEATLLMLSISLGGIGTLCGMIVFRHKISKPVFRYGIPFIVVINMLTYFYLLHPIQ